jgi:hypothetical protein
MAHRQLSNHQKAAHILLPMLAALVGEMRTEADTLEMEADKARKDRDAAGDWKEMALRARGRADGAARMLAVVRSLARG